MGVCGRKRTFNHRGHPVSKEDTGGTYIQRELMGITVEGTHTMGPKILSLVERLSLSRRSNNTL